MSGTAGIRHVAMVGLMGSGKTTIGRRVAALLGWPLRDSDVEIEARYGRTVRELRDERGTDGMHELEAAQLIGALADPSPSVVCAAASTADSPACLAALADPAVLVVFLTVRPEVGARRFLTGAHRPWFGDDPAAFLADQAVARYPRIRALNPLEVATDERTVEDTVRLVAGRLEADGVLPAPAQGR